MARKITFLLATVTLLTVAFSTTAWSQAAKPNSRLAAKADRWFDRHKYLKGLTILPHDSVNRVEFFLQYKKNPSRWDAAFAFLKNTNLDTIRVGKYKILGDEVVVNVSEVENRPLEKTKWEFHRKYIDLQYVFRGKETMGVAPLDSLVINNPYSESWDGGTGTFNGGSYYTMDSTRMQLFFPCDAHRPGIAVDGFNRVKKIVIKIKYN